jgi:hypothetical protein
MKGHLRRGGVVLLAVIAVLPVRWARQPLEHAVPEAATTSWPDADWAVFEEKVEWLMRAGADTMPFGEVMAALGGTFVGTAYVPHTLEAAGPEALVINFRGLDCVTFVENVFALARFSREPGPLELMQDRPRAEDRYEALLTELRYRRGGVDGYASRLHYFTDWVKDNESKGLVTDVSQVLGGVRDTEAVDFMTTHTDAYRQLADAAITAEVRASEERLSSLGRFYLPEDRIAEASPGIRNGDVIAATSTVPGLDIAHTGIALWVDGELHLLHAPLVGEEVQISDVSLAERILRIEGQDGIVVARAVER